MWTCTAGAGGRWGGNGAADMPSVCQRSAQPPTTTRPPLTVSSEWCASASLKAPILHTQLNAHSAPSAPAHVASACRTAPPKPCKQLTLAASSAASLTCEPIAKHFHPFHGDCAKAAALGAPKVPSRGQAACRGSSSAGDVASTAATTAPSLSHSLCSAGRQAGCLPLRLL